MAQCLNCDGELIWDADFDYYELGYQGNGIVHIFHCPKCGAFIECKVPTDEETYD